MTHQLLFSLKGIMNMITNKQAIEINSVSEAMADTLISAELAYRLVALRELTLSAVVRFKQMNKPSARFKMYQKGAERIAANYLTKDNLRQDGGYDLTQDQQKSLTRELEIYKEDFTDVVEQYKEQQSDIQLFLAREFKTKLPEIRIEMFPPNVTVGIVNALKPVLQVGSALAEACMESPQVALCAASDAKRIGTTCEVVEPHTG